ncbi:MAG: radical SAM family heme chaperone HemW [Microcoleaceae cyanobacterium]
MNFNEPSLPKPLPNPVSTSAYIHIPFCRRRCYYCDFAVSVVGDRRHGENFSPIQRYVDVLCQEIRQEGSQDIPQELNHITGLQTIFFGGGTPSLLSVGQLNQILTTLNQRFGIARDAEISIEIDPGTFDQEKLQGFIQAGINRVSLGVQAFQDELLQLCGRSHTVAEIYTALDLIHQVGISNFSLDLISGLPTQTLEHWQASLEKALVIAPPHLSHYDLIVEPVTAFGRSYQPGESPLPSDQMTAQMYCLAQQTLTQAGYHHYEVSNYAKPGYHCRHNLVYWHNFQYYGFGMGAASHLQGDRLIRPRQTQLYFDWVEAGDRLAGAEWVGSPQDRLLETLMLGLRLSEGLNLFALAQDFGEKTVEQILTCLDPYHQKGWVECLEVEGKPFARSSLVDISGREPELTGDKPMTYSGKIRLTDPEGFLFSNTVLASLFHQFSNFEDGSVQVNSSEPLLM